MENILFCRMMTFTQDERGADSLRHRCGREHIFFRFAARQLISFVCIDNVTVLCHNCHRCRRRFRCPTAQMEAVNVLSVLFGARRVMASASVCDLNIQCTKYKCGCGSDCGARSFVRLIRSQWVPQDSHLHCRAEIAMRWWTGVCVWQTEFMCYIVNPFWFVPIKKRSFMSNCLFRINIMLRHLVAGQMPASL